jgi:LuxR family maltose regulon positive regulatory protein
VVRPGRTALALDAKFRPPRVRPGIVPRTALVDRLIGLPFAPVVCLNAPAGYGKTTLLAQWANRDGRNLAWVSIDSGDNDTSVLLTNAAVALDRIEPVEAGVFRSLASPAASTAAAAVGRISSTLQSRTEPFRLVLDHAELLENPECIDAVAELAMRLPEESQLAVATRGRPPVPTALLRARRDVLEIGTDDLAMDEPEAGALLEAAGVELGPVDVAELVRRTEGWPVGLYLAALALKAGGRHGAPVAFTGDHRLMADYLRSEFLAHLPDAMVSFLTRTAVLDRLSGPLCDAVLGTTGSAHVLERLESANLLLVALDDRRGWYRYHYLFRELLSAELSRQELALVPELHSRAATWFEGNGMRENALDHAQAAGDADRVARLVAALAQPTYAAGRVDTVRGWFSWFSERDLLNRYPQVSVLGSQMEALLGHPAAAEHWADAAERGHFTGTLPDGSSFQGWLAYLHAMHTRDGVAQMRVDAQLALAEMAPGSFLRGAVLVLEGLSYMLDGELDAADAVFAHAVDVCRYLGARPAAMVALGERAVVAIERHDWLEAERHARQAMAILTEHHLDDYMMAALAYAVSARLEARRGHVVEARKILARSVPVRPLLTYAVPSSAQILLQVAHAYVELADPAGARAVLREVRHVLRQRPDLGVIPQQADELQAKVHAFGETTPGASSLTAAELRVLPFLATYLSLAAIAERLHVSRNTVKSQTISIYQKLGVSSRSEANQRVSELGLLGWPAPLTA